MAQPPQDTPPAPERTSPRLERTSPGAERSPPPAERAPLPAERTPPPAERDSPGAEIRHRSEWEIRWRQARNAPPPVVRAVLANLALATVGGVVLLLSDWLASRGVLPEVVRDLGPLIYIALVVISGSLLTYLWVELPTGVPGEKRRSPWSAVLGFFASIPIVYLALVVIFEILRPLLPG